MLFSSPLFSRIIRSIAYDEEQQNIRSSQAISGKQIEISFKMD